MSIRYVLFACSLILFTLQASALPRFAVRTGNKCQSCHLNPSGGMMRQAYGVQYGREQLPVPAWSKDYSIDDFSNLLGNVLGIGADFQTLYFSQQSTTATTSAFWQMQGDLYLNLRVARKVNLFLSKGLYNGFTAFALLDVLPARGSIKVGKFTPAYGTNIDDHTTFIRTYTGFSPELSRPELTGLEATLSPGPVTIMGGVYNSADGFGSAVGNSKAFLGRAEAMLGGDNSVHIGFGGNVYYNAIIPQSVLQRIDGVAAVAVAGTPKSTLYGGFGSVAISQLAIFGEADWMTIRSDLPDTKSFVCYLEADYPVVTGVDVKVAYDFFDPDVNLKTGTITRYSVGVEFFPLPGVEVRPLYRTFRGANISQKNEVDVLLHLYF
jgi:hypothetical protein